MKNPACLASDGSEILDPSLWQKTPPPGHHELIPMDDVMILVDALIYVAAGAPRPSLLAKGALKKFTAKHRLR
jgi:hypothetical protein